MKSIYKRSIQIVFILLAVIIVAACSSNVKTKEEKVCALNTLTQKEIDEGWELLFDGESTEHWKGYCKDSFPQGWEVVDSTLHVIGSGKGEAGSGGDIITRKMYKNFELSLEWKVSEGGNSGIFYLAQEKPGQPIWKSAPEMQILDNDKHPDAKLGKEARVLL